MKNKAWAVIVLLFVVTLSQYAQENSNWLSLRLVPITSDALLSSTDNGMYSGLSGKIKTNNLLPIPLGIPNFGLFANVKGDFLYGYYFGNKYSYYDVDIGGDLAITILTYPDKNNLDLTIPINAQIDFLCQAKNDSPLSSTDDSAYQFKLNTIIDYMFLSYNKDMTLQYAIVPTLSFSFSTTGTSSADIQASGTCEFRLNQSDEKGLSNIASISTGIGYDDTSFYNHEKKLYIPFSLKLGRALMSIVGKSGIDLGTSGIEFGMSYQLSPTLGIDKLVIAYLSTN